MKNNTNTVPDTLLFIADITNICCHIFTDLITNRCTVTILTKCSSSEHG